MVVAFRAGKIHASLNIGIDIGSVNALQSNGGLSGMGVALHGAGFILAPEIAEKFRLKDQTTIRPYLGGRDLLRTRRDLYVIDFSGLTSDQARIANPAAYQHVIDYVKPERDQNRRDSIRNLWWRFGWERPLLRKAMKDINRYIATTETAKHRAFQFINSDVLPDHMIVCFALDDAWQLGVLSSRIHVVWALAKGGMLEGRPRYNKTQLFDPFPFPDATETQKTSIRKLAEELDAHRKRIQVEHPDITLTGMYNVLEKLKSGEALSDKDKDVHERGLVSVLKDLHERLPFLPFQWMGGPFVW